MEIFKEKVFDLLEGGNSRKELSIRKKIKKLGFFVKDLSKIQVKNKD